MPVSQIRRRKPNIQPNATREPKASDAFRTQVYEVVRAIPLGRVMTYGAVAAHIPMPRGVDPLGYGRIRARWVGYALAACPEDVPWHRVINAQGRISPRIAQGHQLQRVLLEDEGVKFDEHQRIDLARYAWHPGGG
jgi:methylated-DNA-protein-cysteine methyltransferase-like protein